MTNREALNTCSDEALVKFLLRQRGCVLCVVRSRCPQMKSVPLVGEPVKVEDDGLTCADRLLAWLKEEAPPRPPSP